MVHQQQNTSTYKRQLLITLIILITCAQIALAQEGIVLEQQEYVLGEYVYFSIFEEDKRFVEVLFEDRVFRVVTHPLNEYEFLPEYTGEYRIRVLDDSREVLSQKYFVIKQGFGTTEQENIISTQKDLFVLGEEVIVNTLEELTTPLARARVITPTSQYSLIGEPELPLRFSPTTIGEHEIVIIDEDNNRYSVGFMVVADLNETSFNHSTQEVTEEISEENTSIEQTVTQAVRPEEQISTSRQKKESAINVAGLGNRKRGVQLEFFEHDFIQAFQEREQEGSLIRKGAVNRDRAVRGDPVGSSDVGLGRSYDVVARPQNSAVHDIIIRDFVFEEEATIRLEDLPVTNNMGFSQSNALRAFAIEMEFAFEEAYVTSTAVGEELYECKEWDFDGATCQGTWEKVRDIIPGEEYSVRLEPGDPGYIETGVASINTEKSIYRPGEVANIIIVVLDSDGFLVSGADVSLDITSPDNTTTSLSTDFETISETSVGIYEATFLQTDLEGNYQLIVSAQGTNVNDTMISSFLVQEEYAFDIIRDNPVTLDPKKDLFVATTTISSKTVDGAFNYTEVIPNNFTIIDSERADVSQEGQYTMLTWNNLTNNSVVTYSAQLPEVIPWLWQVGPSFVEYREDDFSETFFEARPWYLAADPITYYDPNSNFEQGWSRGTGTGFDEISKGIRQPNTPDTSSFVGTRRGDGDTSEFGFPAVVEEDVETVTLWVYTATGSNVEYTYELRQGTTVVCDNLVPSGTGQGWQSCEWTNPTGDLDDLRIFLGTGESVGGGKPENAFVYATYIEVETATPPPVVSLISPEDESVVESSPVSFMFQATDNTFSIIDECILYGDFSGVWSSMGSETNVNNATSTVIEQAVDNGVYSWNVFCENEEAGAFAPTNFTVTTNLDDPVISNQAINTTNIVQGGQVFFDVTITDFFGVDTAKVIVERPDSSSEELVLDRTGSVFSTTITDTAQIGDYTITSIWANDTLGRVGEDTSSSLSFSVSENLIGTFSLLAPLNSTESRELNPTMVWEETTTNNFGNYTLQLSKDASFSLIDFVYSTSSITTTEFALTFALDVNEKYYWRVLAYDNFGNVQESNEVFTYVNDRIAPNVSLNQPNNDSFVTQHTVLFNYTPSDDNTITSCSLYTNSSGSWQGVNASSSVTKNVVNTLSGVVVEGLNLWNVLCVDEAGNEAFATNNRTVILDTTGPVVTLLSPTNNALINDTNIIVFEAEAFDELANIDSCNIYIDDVLTDTDDTIVDGVPFEFELFLSNNEYEWRVECIDTNDNVGVSETRTLEVLSLDNDPPVIVLNNPGANEFVPTDTIIFNYTPQDATGINNCSLAIDGDVVSTDFSVTNFEPNTFEETGFVEDSYLWQIICYDNSTQLNRGESSTRTFTVDLTDPIVTLDGPSDGAERTTSSVTFLYTPSDTNLDSCSLYTNETGAWSAQQTTSSPSNNIQNSFVRSMPDGVFVWNVLCSDFSGRSSFATNNHTVLVDTTAPQYANQEATPSSPTTYDPSQTHVFSIDWIDNFAVDTVLFEHNFSGMLTNETPTQTGDTFLFNTTGLGAGSYSVRWFANDTFGNTNQTAQQTYTVNKAESIIELRLNNVQDNITVDEEDVVSLNTTLITPTSGVVELLLDDEVISVGSSPLVVNEQFMLPGLFEIVARFNETNNYLSSTKKFFVEVLDVTPPEVTLISPSNDSLIGDGEITLSYTVSDNSPVTSCSLYLDNVFEQTNTSITRDTTQFFAVDLPIGSYTWRVECDDSASNTGVSETRTFEAVDTDELLVTVSFDNATVEVGRNAEITTTVTDFFTNPLTAFVQTSIINSTTPTTSPWWDDGWTKRKQLSFTEPSNEELINGLAQINITGLTDITSCESGLRIVNQGAAQGVEVPFTAFAGDDASWCSVAFLINLTASEEDQAHYVYYDNPSATNPNYGFSISDSSLFNAGSAAADEGTPTNVNNIIGLDDGTSATLNQGGGGGTHSAHGTTFIAASPGAVVEQVEARYRFEVPEASSTTWQLRYSTNNGVAYSTAQSGASSIAKTTSGWFDITSAYSSLSWSAVNNTRLQGRIVKTGGGCCGTMDLFWVELRVTFVQPADVEGNVFGNEEQLVATNSGTTSSSGTLLWTWNTGSVSADNYSVVSLASRNSYTPSSDAGVLEVVPDLTPPTVDLLSPADGFEQGKGLVNFTYEVFDPNLDSCSLLLGDVGGSLAAEASDANPDNNETNTFENVFVDIGLYDWNVECEDAFDNVGQAPENFFLNISAPDLVVRESDIWFAQTPLVEGVNTTVFANITNEGLSAADDPFVVQFFLEDPAVDGVQIGSNQTISSLESLESVTLNTSFELETGDNNVFVVVDQDNVIEEADVSNNNASNFVSVETYQYYYGNVSVDIILGDANVSSFIDYLEVTNQQGHVFFADEDSDFNFGDLQAVTRNIDGNLVSGDFDAVDQALGTSEASDSIKELWGEGGNTPVETKTFNISTGAIHNVPIVLSTEYEEFVTGMLWDTAGDTGNERFDVDDRENIVFITKISPQTQGRYGVYDYEIRVPSKLREYAGSTRRVSFYVEIT